MSKIQNLILSLLTVFISFPGYSATPQPSGRDGTVVALFTPWPVFQKSLQSLLSGYTISNQQSLPDQIVQASGLNWHVNQISWKLKSNFITTQTSQNSLQLDSKNLQLALSIGQISVDQVIQKVVGGSTIDIHIQAQCDPIQLSQTQAHGSAHVVYQFSAASITTQVDQVQLQWPANTWSVGALNCRGPKGLDSALKNELFQQLRSSTPLLPFIQSGLATGIQSGVNQLISRLKLPTPIQVSGNKLPLHLSFAQFQSMTEGLLVYGQLTWPIQGASRTPENLMISRLPSEVATSRVPVLLTPTLGWSRLIRAEVAANPVSAKISLNQIPAFQNLLNNRLQQLFAWPDLLHYEEEDPFSFVARSLSIQTISWNDDGSLDAELSTRAVIQSQREQKVWDYLLVSGNGSTHLTPTVKNGVLSVSAQVQVPQLNFQFGDQYVETFHPPTEINSVVLDAVSQSLKTSLKFSTTLPVLDLGPLGQARFNGWESLPGALIAVPLKLK